MVLLNRVNKRLKPIFRCMLFTLLAQMNLVIRTSALGTTYASDSDSVIERTKI